ncbi:MAG: hypothetical protein ACI9J3_003590 [Parvicellaceae bacterium]|jgi:hypothetical protein
MAIIWVKDKLIKNRYNGHIDGSTQYLYVHRKDGLWQLDCPDGTIVRHEETGKLKAYANYWIAQEGNLDEIGISTDKGVNG